MERKRFYHIDFLRFVFAVYIVYYHVLHANIMPFVQENSVYADLAKRSDYAANLVAFYFILGGVFLYRSVRFNPDVGVFDFIMSRVFRLWPVLCAAILAEWVFNPSTRWETNFLRLFFLQCSGLSLEYKGILWYVSSFFFASIFYHAILKVCRKDKAIFFVALLTYFALAFQINYTNGTIGGRETVLYVINLGVLRGIWGMGLGILIGALHEKICESLQPFSVRVRRFVQMFRIAFETFAIFYLGRYFLYSPSNSNHLAMVLMFSCLLLSMLFKGGGVEKLFGRKYLGHLGKYAYSIYVFQQTGFYLMRKMLWKYQAFIGQPILALSISVLLSVMLGIAGYYVIERPCTRKFEQWHKRACIR